MDPRSVPHVDPRSDSRIVPRSESHVGPCSDSQLPIHALVRVLIRRMSFWIDAESFCAVWINPDFLNKSIGHAETIVGRPVESVSILMVH